MNKITLSEIKAHNQRAGFHFFDRETMRFFGDTMRSFRAITKSTDGKIYVERVRAIKDGGGGVGKLYEYNPITGGIQSVQTYPH